MRNLIFLLCAVGFFGASLANDNNECSLYLAESSIKGAGWGVFAGKNYAVGDKLGEPGLGIQIIDTHQIHERGALQEYIMSSSTIGGNLEARSAFTFLAGVRNLVNYHGALPNVFVGGLTLSSSPDRDSPTVGSYTNYHNASLIASNPIQRGHEVFLDPSPEWLKEAGQPSREDYAYARKIVASLLDYHKKFPDLSEVQWIDILYRVREEMLGTDAAALVVKLIPQSLQELLELRAVEVAKMIPRNWEWVTKNGYCLDNIRERPSTIKNAGRGAFAKRRLSKDTIIAPAPLVQVFDKSTLAIDMPNNSTSQLLVNYCFGHDKSNLLLCPTTQVTLINHNSKSPNAVIRWSRNSQNRIDDKDYRVESLDALTVDFNDKKSFNTRLSFEVVAIADIEAGEEIFLDYGKAWEAAFARHEQQWSSPKADEPPPNVLNEKMLPIGLSTDLSPRYAHECRIEPLAPERESTSGVGEDYKSRHEANPENWNEKWKLMYGDNDFLCWYPCFVTGLNSQGETFQVDVWSKRTSDHMVIRKYKNLPREAIRFTSGRYQSDQHLKAAFRHYIQIPDNMFPLRWRSDYTTGASLHLGTREIGLDVTQKENQHLQDVHEETVRDVECGVYFAPSNIPHAGFGTYTAVDLMGKGLVLGTSMPVIPVVKNFPSRWNGDDYAWNGQTYRAEYESASAPTPMHETVVLAVNDGALANSHLGLVNEYLHPSVFDPLLDGCKDPGAGAISDYVSYSFRSSFSMGMGEELFVHYGESWFTARAQFEDVPLTSSWKSANDIVASVWSMSQLETQKLEEHEMMGLLDAVKGSLVGDHRTKMALGSVSSIAHVMERNGTAQATMQKRTPEWFKENGQCLDHVYVKKSTIPQAGHGGFARRLLKQGTSIISSPLMTTFGEDMMQVNVTKANETMVGREINDKLLFLNYQFYHPNSTAYFFPINHAYIINHNSERMSRGKKPNARLQWATWDRKSNYFLQRPIQDLKKEHYSTIVLDIVATRDIRVDEEVFIDYGVEWEDAWKTHVANWKTPCKSYASKSSKMVKAMNLAKFSSSHQKWSDDHFTVCKPPKSYEEGVHLVQESDKVPKGIRETTSIIYHGITWNHPGFEYSRSGKSRLPCQIISSDPEAKTFSVAIFDQSKESKIPELAEARVLQIAQNLPAHHLDFINRPFRSDMHLKGAFRHPIKLPDDIFPPQWKDSA